MKVWFLWFWLISSVCCEIVSLLVASTMLDRIKREMPELTNVKPIRDWKGQLKSFLTMLTPFLNILIGLVMVFGYNSVCTAVKEDLSRKVR